MTVGTSHRLYSNGRGKTLTIAITGGKAVKREYLKLIIDVLELEA